MLGCRHIERTRGRTPLVLVVCCAAWLAATAATAGAPPLAGLTLEEALRSLEARGLRLVFTSSVVRADMRVEHQPRAGEPRRILDEILQPHGLMARDSIGGRLLIVRAPPPAAEDLRGKEAARRAPPPRVEIVAEAIDVTSSRPRILGEQASAFALEARELVALPQIGDDVLRPLTLLPGTAGNDVSAGFSVRGGRQDEVSVRLDGLEILEPFHLKDLGSALSILAPVTLAEVELLTGGYSVEYGDRMSGVLEMTTLEPTWQRRSQLGLSVLQGQASTSGTAGDGQRHWLASLRGGSLELPFQLAGEEENPRFWDAFGKLETRLGQRQSLRLQTLVSDDRLDFVETDGDAGAFERFRTAYVNTYAWLSHQAVLGPALVLESTASYSRLERDRQGREEAPSGGFSLRDERRLDTVRLAQSWNLRLDERLDLKWGFELHRLNVDYDYRNQRALTDPLAAIRHLPAVGTTDFDQSFDGQSYGTYVSGRLSPLPPLVVELGLRFDENTIIEDHLLAPRLHLAWALGPRSRLRAAWGIYHQSQRIYELQVEDGETDFAANERTEHRILSFEHSFGGDRRSLNLRAELYERRIRDPRVRYENLFDPLSIVPELEADRVRVAPESARSRGLEIFLEGKVGRRFDWLVSTSHAGVEDRIDGRGVPRNIDQPHSLGLAVTWRTPWKWDLGVSFEPHTGWPTTAIAARSVELPDGSSVVEPVLGPLYGERLPDYRRLDLRTSRRFRLGRGELRFFLEIQNLIGTRNVRGFDVSFEPGADGEVETVSEPRSWGKQAPYFGVSWTF